MPILKPNTIITPHVKEFRRWIVDWADDLTNWRNKSNWQYNI